MNRLILSLLVLLSLASVGFCIVCTPELCEGAKCTEYTGANCAGKIVKHGGFCGCCDSCVTLIKKGQSCAVIHLLGVPSTAECDTGLICDPLTAKCI